MILRKVNPPKHNITMNETTAIKDLKANKDIMIMKADKGNTTVVLNMSDYEAKMIEHLTTKGCYKKMTTNPSVRIIKEVIKAINDSSLDDGIKKKTQP